MNNLISAFVIGTPYSGSTILGEYLNNYKGTFFAGELARFEPLHEQNHLYEQASMCLSCALTNSKCPVFNEHLQAKMKNSNPIDAHKKLARLTSSDVIVDGSKFVNWLNMATVTDNAKQTDIRAIITVKNPISFVESCLAREENIGVPAHQLANLWRDTYYDCLRSVSTNNISFFIVRNEDFSTANPVLLRNIASFLNLQSKKVSPLHAIGGNPGVLEGKKFSDEFAQTIEQSKQHSFLIHREFMKRGKIKRFSKPKLNETQKSEVLQTPGLVDVAVLLGYDPINFN